MMNIAVVGTQWGDEGKAKIVDFLTEEADLVIRFQGGANAGHTVEVGDQKFVFFLDLMDEVRGRAGFGFRGAFLRFPGLMLSFQLFGFS